MSQVGRTRVVVTDRHDLFAECLGLVLQARGYLVRKVPMPTTGRPESLLSRLVSKRPDVTLINANLGIRGLESSVISGLARHGIAVAVLADFAEEERRGEFLAAGARIVVPKTQTLSAVVSVVRQLARGEKVLDCQERERLIALGNERQTELRAARTLLSRLSVQEAVVLRHLMAGHGVGEIAVVRTVSDSTVRSQIKSILAKLEVSSQLSAVALAHQAEWIAASATDVSVGATSAVLVPRPRLGAAGGAAPAASRLAR